MAVKITSRLAEWTKFAVQVNRSGFITVPRHSWSLSQYLSIQPDSLQHRKQTDNLPVSGVSQTKKLNDGVEIPNFGLGVWKLHSVEAILWALDQGYRLIDTAARYGNEADVGTAVRKCGIPRQEIFIVTKLYDTDHGFEETLKAFELSLSKLGLDHIDQYLIHSPVGGRILETWEAMVKLKNDKLVRSIGVSNFGIHHLKELRKHSTIIPAVNQIELHPYLQERELVAYCQELGIHLQAYRSLVCGTKINDPLLTGIAQKHNKTPAQVLIRWCVQNGYCCIPKSEKKSRIVENMKVFDFDLDADDMNILNGLEEGLRSCHFKIEEPWTG